MCNTFDDVVLEAVRGLRVAEPDLGLKPLLAKLREQQPDLGADTKEVRKALTALKTASARAARAAALEPAANEGVPPVQEGGAPPNAALSLACVGSVRMLSDMDDEREKPAAATPHHPPSFLAASPPCDTSRARGVSARVSLLLFFSCPK